MTFIDGLRMTPWMTSVLAMVTFTGCTSTEEQERRSLSAAVVRFRSASNEERAALAPEIAKVSCTSAAMKTPCEVCARAAADTGRALELKAGVEKTLASLAEGKVERERTGLDLDEALVEALRLLEDGRQGMNRCETLLEELALRSRR